MTSIKQENGGAPIKAEESEHNGPFQVKNEPMSDEEYEDAGDLDMTNGHQMGWLIKIPKYLYERWDEIDDDEEITLGEVLINPANDEKFKIKLNENIEVHKDLPLNYDMILNERSVENTWVFSEKDMPGFDKKTNVVADANMPELPARFLYGDREKKNYPDKPKGQWNKNQHRAPYIRKAIPKKTAVVGTIAHEAAIITPLEDPKYHALMKAQALRSIKPKKFELLTGVQSGNLLAPGTMGAATGNFDTFIKRVEPTKKPQENKAARMEKHALIDALFACFKQYKAWTMKGLKEKLNQPEAYLKEVLNEIASLHKTGPLASKYTLKPEYAQHTEEQIQAALEAENGDGRNSGDAIPLDDEEDDEEFEDAL